MTMVEHDPAFQLLTKLIGTWKLNSRTLDSGEDNIIGETTIQPILDGAYLEARGWWRFKDSPKFENVEIIHYDAVRKVFPSSVYVNMGESPGGAPLPYKWFIEENGTVIHRGAGAIYRRKFSEDCNVLDGGWRPDKSEDSRDEAAYDATMTRIKKS